MSTDKETGEHLALICATLVHRHALLAIKEKNPAGWNRIGAVNFAWWCQDLEGVQKIADKLEDFIARLESK